MVRKFMNREKVLLELRYVAKPGQGEGGASIRSDVNRA